MRRLIALGFVYCAASIANPQTPEGDGIATTPAPVLRPIQECVAELAEQPKFKALSQRLPLGAGDPTMEMLANEAKVKTPAERATVVEGFEWWRQCGLNSTERAKVVNEYPFLVPIAEKNIFVVEQIGVELARGHISYGDAAQQIHKARQNTIDESRAAVAQFNEQYRQAQQARAAQVAEQNREARAQALQSQALAQAQADADQRAQIAQQQLNLQRAALVQQSFAQQQANQRAWYEAQMRAIQQANRPLPGGGNTVHTTCTNYVPNQVNCTSN
jgi:hypothetical protein